MSRIKDKLRPAVRTLREERRLWPIRVHTRRDLSPPPTSAFRHYGTGAVIVPPARINHPECISIEDGAVVLEGAWLAVFPQAGQPRPQLTIGARTRIGRSCHIACVGEVSIGEDVLTADHVFVADTYHGFEQAGVPIMRQPMAPHAAGRHRPRSVPRDPVGNPAGCDHRGERVRRSRSRCRSRRARPHRRGGQSGTPGSHVGRGERDMARGLRVGRPLSR